MYKDTQNEFSREKEGFWLACWYSTSILYSLQVEISDMII